MTETPAPIEPEAIRVSGFKETETFDFEGPAGRIEAILNQPAQSTPARAAAVICHAHPLHGGMMHFKVIFRAAKALQSQGIASLRFNFRGVGRSEGSHDRGTGEQDDARAALSEMARRFPGLPLILGGFSFGAAMAVKVAATDDRVKAVVILGFPITRVDSTADLSGLRQPRLFVQGSDDEFGPGHAIRQMVAGLPEPRRLEVIEGADHFFTGRLDELQNAIQDWASTLPWESR
ncbi:MAG: alpha/beta fold hydrolase [Vicinamibacteria bacterium]|nr:alpha/beta fold hydrolase [Vicinamibacteria bacterium]